MERLANEGYLAIKKESVKGTAVTPNVYVPFYSESLSTDLKLDEDSPVIGNRFARFQTLMGKRSHGGEIKVLAEPKTAGYFFDMMLVKGSPSGGSDPYTYPFTLSNNAEANAYTIDILKGQVVHRFIGCEIESIGIEFSENKMMFVLSISARKSVLPRKISANSPTGTLNLYTGYDSAPTDGFVASDLVRLFKADGSTIDTTVSSITDGDTIVVASATGVADGDYIALRGATPSPSIETPFMWGRTEFRFGATAAAALSATQTRVEEGSAYTITNKFEKKEGAQRSGSFDPATLPRLDGDLTVNTKMFFDTPDDMVRFLEVTKRALVIRHFSGTNHELRITINNMKARKYPNPAEVGNIIYADIDWAPDYDTSDAQAFDVKVLNGLATI